jgi:hypothetical protein
MADGLLSAEQFSTTTLRRVLEPCWKLLAAELLIALAFVLALPVARMVRPRKGVVDYFNVGSRAPSETFQPSPGDFGSAAQPPRTQTEQVLAVI